MLVLSALLSGAVWWKNNEALTASIICVAAVQLRDLAWLLHVEAAATIVCMQPAHKRLYVHSWTACCHACFQMIEAQYGHHTIRIPYGMLVVSVGIAQSEYCPLVAISDPKAFGLLLLMLLNNTVCANSTTEY